MADGSTASASVTGAAAATTVVVVGASGDLARKKTFPSLFALFGLGLLPRATRIVGFARSAMSTERFRQSAGEFLSDEFGERKKEEFLDLCGYFSGQYGSADSFSQLVKERIAPHEEGYSIGNRLFYLAIPPSVFLDVSKAIRAVAMASKTNSWTRVVVEKPFGRDLQSFLALERDLSRCFSETEVFRIDHYLGKEMVQNLLVLRFANSIMQPVWSRHHIKAVMITFKEPFGTEGRGGYFDQFGIVRDVMQNHLCQILSLVAMEAPVSLQADDVRDEKVKVLKCIAPIKPHRAVIGQYGRGAGGRKAFIDDDTVPPDSLTPTFAAAVLKIKNERWRGVPFIVKCGKALDQRKAEIRIQFRPVANQLFRNTNRNELVIRVQPDEAVYCKFNAKIPGMSSHEEAGFPVIQTELDLTYQTRFAQRLPDAYERLLFDVFRGDHNLFVRGDELEASWRVFTPWLQHLEQEKIRPIIYPYGSRGPAEADELAKRYGYARHSDYTWTPPVVDDEISSDSPADNAGKSRL